MQPPDPPAPPVEYDPDRHWRNEDAGPDASPWATDSEGPSSPSGLGPSGRAASGAKPARIAWTPTEHQAFLDGLGNHGRNWRAISKLIGPSRSLAQVRGGGRQARARARSAAEMRGRGGLSLAGSRAGGTLAFHARPTPSPEYTVVTHPVGGEPGRERLRIGRHARIRAAATHAPLPLPPGLEGGLPRPRSPPRARAARPRPVGRPLIGLKATRCRV